MLLLYRHPSIHSSMYCNIYYIIIIHPSQDWRIQQAMQRGDWYRTKDILNQGTTDAVHPSNCSVYPYHLIVCPSIHLTVVSIHPSSCLSIHPFIHPPLDHPPLHACMMYVLCCRSRLDRQRVEGVGSQRQGRSGLPVRTQMVRTALTALTLG